MKLLALVLAALAMVGQNAEARNFDGENGNDRVLSKIHTSNLNEIAQANIALQKAQTMSVKNFAQMIVGDHTLADQQLAPLAAKLQLPVRDFVPKSSREMKEAQKDQQMLQSLQGAAADQFDKTFLDIQVMCHKNVLKWLQQRRSYVDDEDEVEFVDMQIATVEAHLKIAQKLQDTY